MSNLDVHLTGRFMSPKAKIDSHQLGTDHITGLLEGSNMKKRRTTIASKIADLFRKSINKTLNPPDSSQTSPYGQTEA